MGRTAWALTTRTTGLTAALAAMAVWGLSCADPVHIAPPTVQPSGEGGQGATATGGGAPGGGGGTTVCRSNSDCPAPTAVCDTVKEICVECLELADCAHMPGTVCSEGACVCLTAGESWCEPDLCVDLQTSPVHCGQCDHPCFGACADGACVDEWEPTSMDGAPQARSMHTAVWTDSLMIVWGGSASSTNTDNLNTGAMYDPAAFEWTATSTVNAPSPRREHAAVWTGTEMLVWGGRHGAATDALATGGRFDPATNTWQPMTTDNAPPARHGHTAVWTGTHLIVWGGTNGTSELTSGGSYDPTADEWETLIQPGQPEFIRRAGHSAVWSGSQMLVYGGRYTNVPYTYLPDGTNYAGLEYEPGASTPWSAMVSSGQPTARAFHSAVMMGNSMVIWGGFEGASPLSSGARWDTQASSWSATNAPQPEGRYHHSAVVLDDPDAMVVWGGNGVNGELESGGMYSLSSNTWSPMATALSARTRHTAVSTGSTMIVWGGSLGNARLNDGGVFDPN